MKFLFSQLKQPVQPVEPVQEVPSPTSVPESER